MSLNFLATKARRHEESTTQWLRRADTNDREGLLPINGWLKRERSFQELFSAFKESGLNQIGVVEEPERRLMMADSVLLIKLDQFRS